MLEAGDDAARVQLGHADGRVVRRYSLAADAVIGQAVAAKHALKVSGDLLPPPCEVACLLGSSPDLTPSMTPPTRSSQVKDWCLIIMFLAAVFAAISMATERSERTRQETLALCLGVFGLAFLVASVKYWWPNSRRFRSVSTVTAAWGALVCLYYSFFAAAGWYGAEIKAILITLAAPAAMLAPMGYRLLVDSQGLAPRGQPPPSPGMEQLFDNMTGLGAAKKYPSMEIPKLPEQLRERVVALLVVICDRAKVWDPAKWTCDEAQALSEIAMTGRVQRLHLVCLRSHARSAWLIGREMRGANQPRIDNLLAQLELVVKEALQDLEVVLSKRPAR